MTLEEIRIQGLCALRERLGRVGMVRFLQQFETGLGDYAKERHEWVERVALDDLRARSSKRRSRKKPNKR
jgi:hypothetical protein